MRKLRRKRRTREHVIADLGVNHVERHALLCGFVVERLVYDYGIDLVLFTFSKKGEIEEGKVLLQVKASDRLRVRQDRATFAFRVERRDLVSWLAQPMPVVLVVYDARKDRAFWLYVQSHFHQLQGFNLFTAGQSVTVHVPTANVVDGLAMRTFGRLRDRVLKQIRELIHDDK